MNFCIVVTFSYSSEESSNPKSERLSAIFESELVPADCVHHRLRFGCVRSDILAKHEIFVLKDWLEKAHLLARIKIESIICWHCSTINRSRRVKKMNFVHQKKGSHFFKLGKVVFRRRIFVNDVRDRPSSPDKILFERVNENLLLFAVFRALHEILHDKEKNQNDKRNGGSYMLFHRFYYKR